MDRECFRSALSVSVSVSVFGPSELALQLVARCPVPTASDGLRSVLQSAHSVDCLPEW